jgi:hypothetical protein
MTILGPWIYVEDYAGFADCYTRLEYISGVGWGRLFGHIWKDHFSEYWEVKVRSKEAYFITLQSCKDLKSAMYIADEFLTRSGWRLLSKDDKLLVLL